MSTAGNIYAERIKSEAGKYIALVKGERGGKRCWYYVLSTKIKMPMLLRECNQRRQNLNIENFGTILKSGWGDEPPQYIIEKIGREGAQYDDSEFAVPADNPDQQFYVESYDAGNGRKFFMRINVPGPLTAEFQKVCTGGACDLTVYGEVVESGWLE